MKEPIGTIWNLGYATDGSDVALTRIYNSKTHDSVWRLDRGEDHVRYLKTEQLIELGEIAKSCLLEEGEG